MAAPSDPATAQPRSLADWLRTRTDDELTRLLRRRPDLTLPGPPDFPTLASRMTVRTSVQRALDTVNGTALRTLEALVLGTPELLGDGPSDLDELRTTGLVWGSDDDLHVSAGVAEALGPYPAGLGRPLSVLLQYAPAVWTAAVARYLGAPADADGVAAAVRAGLPGSVAGLEDAERDVLDRLAAGPPIGVLPHALAPSADPDSAEPPRRLAMRGLLIPIDSGLVEMPREVALALRGSAPLGPARSQAPGISTVERDVDALGTTAVLEALRLVEGLAGAWSAQAPPMLRSGGIGVRELRRTARELGVGEPVAALLIEVAYAAGLLNTTSGLDPTYLPTPEYDAWRATEPGERWATLAGAWFAMSRQPSLVGLRGDRDRVIGALSPDAERGTLPVLRATVLGLLSALPPGTAPASRDEVLDRLAWQSPRRASSQRPLAAALLAEADLLGVTAAGGLTGYGRAVVAGLGRSAAEAVTAALPAPVDEFLVQPDLTVVVPGPPTPALANVLSLVADLESTGGASVYRVTEQTVRRGLDAGLTAQPLRALFSEHSRTPVPQALTYLIDDAARRHGVLRSGPASSYLRSEDETLLASVLGARSLAGLELQRIAPTVLVSSRPVVVLLAALREQGFAPAAESPDGSVLSLEQDVPRAPSRNAGRIVRPRPATETAGHLTAILQRLRTSEMRQSASAYGGPPLAVPVPGVTSAATLGLLREAVRNSRTVEVDYVDGEGFSAQATVLPISLGGGVLRGHERGTRQLRAFPLHRLTSVHVLPDDEDD